MYDDMTLEQMIRRLYDGNFTTGELERQLIAEIFMKMLDEQTPEPDNPNPLTPE